VSGGSLVLEISDQGTTSRTRAMIAVAEEFSLSEAECTP
jgi:hypothetical protein